MRRARSSIRRSLVSLSTANPLRFRIQQRVQRLLDARAHGLIDMAPHTLTPYDRRNVGPR